MVPLSELSPGVRVKIVDRWNDNCKQNSLGRMDKYLGRVVTIFGIHKNSALIEEDAGDNKFQAGGHWYWNQYCFDYIVEDEGQENFDVSSKDEMLSFIIGN